MTITILGSGTSHGVPAIACKCAVCCSRDPRDKRTRASVLVTEGSTNILIDIGPDFRAQALRENITSVSAVLLTHSHADHLHGLDDIRIFSHTKSEHHPSSAPMNIWANADTLRDVRNRFDYIFINTQAGGGKPLLRLEDVVSLNEGHPSEFGTLLVTPVPMLHGNCPTTGYIFRHSPSSSAGKKEDCSPNFLTNKNNASSSNPPMCKTKPSKLTLSDDATKLLPPTPSVNKTAPLHPAPFNNGMESVSFAPPKEGPTSFVYLTDCNYISPESIALIKSITGRPTVLVIDGLRPNGHSTHYSYLEALTIANELEAKNTYLTHIAHAMSHKDIKRYIADNLKAFPNLLRAKSHGGKIAPAYDGLVLKIPYHL